jgi:membrane protein
LPPSYARALNSLRLRFNALAHSTFELLERAFEEWRKDNASLMAAALAYYCLFSFSPLLITLVALFGFLLGQGKVEEAVVSGMSNLVGPEGSIFIQDMIENAIDPAHTFKATALSMIILLVGSTRLFIQTKKALNMIWGVKPSGNDWALSEIRSYLASFALIAVLGFVLLISSLANALIMPASHYLEEALPVQFSVLQLTGFGISFLFIAALSAISYKTLSGVYLSFSEILPGAVITAILFSIGNLAIELYVGISGMGSVYGAAGSLIVFLFWVFYSAQIFLFGAELIKVRRHIPKSMKNKN